MRNYILSSSELAKPCHTELKGEKEDSQQENMSDAVNPPLGCQGSLNISLIS